MPNLLKTISYSSIFMTIVFGILYSIFDNIVLFYTLLVFGLLAYHLTTRMYLGDIIDSILHNKVNYKKAYFREHKWEKPLYKILHIKNIKAHLPTYYPELFSLETQSVEDIIMVMCQAEIVHTTNMVISFVPLLLAIWIKHLPFLLVTSLFAAMMDSLFVMTQRYNRPRLMKIQERNEKIKPD